MTALNKQTAKVADLIVNEFIRLGVSTDNDPYSGLMTKVPNIVTTEVLISIFDDYAEGIYDGKLVLAKLKTLAPDDVSLDSRSVNNIWRQIAEFEV